MASTWQYSVPVDAEQARNTGCFTSLPIRIHERNDIADSATQQSLEDWGLTEGDDGSCWSPVGNWGAFIFPESLPERLGVITYLANIGNIHDDLCDKLDYNEATAEHASLSKAMDTSGSEGDEAEGRSGERTQMFKQCIGKALLQAIEVDRPRAMRMIDSYRKKWLDVMETRSPQLIETLDEYLAFRNLNGGMEPYWHLVQYGMAIDISKEQANRIRPIFQAAESALVLTNDYWSWDREWRAALAGQNPRIVNAIELLMRTTDMSMEEARRSVHDRILNYEAQFIDRKEEFYRVNPELPHHLRRYIEVCGSVVAGNHYWCANCPRHNVWRTAEYAQSDCSSVPKQSETSDVSDGHKQSSPSIGPSTIPSIGSTDLTEAPTEGIQDELMPQAHVCSCSDGISTGTKQTSVLDQSALRAPIKYICSMPSKGFRTMMIDSLDTWFDVNPMSLKVIKSVVDTIHQASLIMDDIEDGSQLRRGYPATQNVFGISQSVNSANFMWVHAVRLVSQLHNPACLPILLDGLDELLLGQSWDLRWRHELYIPSEKEYLEMVEHKTGGLFKVLLRLMSLESQKSICSKELDNLGRVFGQYFQIRDDFMNLCSEEQREQKGLCEDLDEGKLSYPLLQLLLSGTAERDVIIGILREHHVRRCASSASEIRMPTMTKLYMLKCMEKACAFEATVARLKGLELEISEMITVLAKQFGRENALLRVLLTTLNVDGLERPTVSNPWE